jgi:uncharacterized protein
VVASTTWQAEHFERLAALQPELVIFGSGARMRSHRPPCCGR